MWYDGLFEEMEKAADAAQGEKMSAYMQNRFAFLGIKKPILNAMMKPYLKAAKKLAFDWDFVFLCWDKPYREAQYVAVEYILQHQRELVAGDIDRVKRMITEKSWWETVDSLDAVCGTLALKYPELKNMLLDWSRSDNLWLRRTAIDFQQEYKDKTDTALLEQIIINNLGSREFFINKAIGWSLRISAQSILHIRLPSYSPRYLPASFTLRGASLSPYFSRNALTHAGSVLL